MPTYRFTPRNVEEHIDQARADLSIRTVEYLEGLLHMLRVAEERMHRIHNAIANPTPDDGTFYGSQEEACVSCRQELIDILPASNEWFFPARPSKKIVQLEERDACFNCKFLAWGTDEGWDKCEIDGTGIDWARRKQQKCEHHVLHTDGDPRNRKR